MPTVTPADSIAQYIATDLALGVLGTTVFEEQMADASDGSVDTAICVYSMPGQPPDLSVGVGTNTIDYPAFQVVCRSLDAATALANDLAIFQDLHGKAETTVHGTYFTLITAIQSAPVSLGRDPRQRFLFARNYRTIARGTAR